MKTLVCWLRVFHGSQGYNSTTMFAFRFCVFHVWFGLTGNRWDVYRGTEWVDRVGSRDAIRNDSCSLHIDKQRAGFYGKETLYSTNHIEGTTIVGVLITNDFAVRQIQKLWLWKMPKSLLLWPTLFTCWSIGHPSSKHRKDILPQMWRRLLPTIKIPRKYPFLLLGLLWFSFYIPIYYAVLLLQYLVCCSLNTQ